MLPNEQFDCLCIHWPENWWVKINLFVTNLLDGLLPVCFPGDLHKKKGWGLSSLVKLKWKIQRRGWAYSWERDPGTL